MKLSKNSIDVYWRQVKPLSVVTPDNEDFVKKVPWIGMIIRRVDWYDNKTSESNG